MSNSGLDRELLNGASRGFKDRVLKLLEEGANVNAVDEENGSALAQAARWGHYDVVSLLLDAGADVDLIFGKHHHSALTLAVASGYDGVVSLLLERGTDADLTGGEHGSALLTAIVEQVPERANVVSILMRHGAEVNLIAGHYGTALAAAAYSGQEEIVTLLLGFGADVNTVGGKYGTALGAAAYRAGVNSSPRDRSFSPFILRERVHDRHSAMKSAGEMVRLLVQQGADLSLVGGAFGTVLGSALAGAFRPSRYKGYLDTGAVRFLLDRGANINMVCCKYGSPLGNALYDGNEEIVPFLLIQGADPFHVGGEYETAMGKYPTAFDALAQSGNANAKFRATTYALLSRAMTSYLAAGNDRTNTPWPPFPIPYTGSYVPPQVTLLTAGHFKDMIKTQGQAHDNLTPEQADLPCTAFDEEMLMKVLVPRVGVDMEAAERCKVWIRNDVRYFIKHEYDLGLSYAAARIGWKGFNDPEFNIAIHRAQWLEKARQIDQVRENTIYIDETGQEIIKLPYQIMPRRIWDLQSNRVVEFRMLHSEASARQVLSSRSSDIATAHPAFWAITHSWTSKIVGLNTTVNQWEWPVPLPHNLDLGDLRKELLGFGAEYVWLDVLCLRQQAPEKAFDPVRKDEWKLDVPTIGNIYRSAVAIVRYFNGLGQSFKNEGWDDERHWLQRAWTLQEIKTANTTFNAGMSYTSNKYPNLYENQG